MTKRTLKRLENAFYKRKKQKRLRVLIIEKEDEEFVYCEGDKYTKQEWNDYIKKLENDYQVFIVRLVSAEEENQNV